MPGKQVCGRDCARLRHNRQERERRQKAAERLPAVAAAPEPTKSASNQSNGADHHPAADDSSGADRRPEAYAPKAVALPIPPAGITQASALSANGSDGARVAAMAVASAPVTVAPADGLASLVINLAHSGLQVTVHGFSDGLSVEARS
jgi:hypothetical protein